MAYALTLLVVVFPQDACKSLERCNTAHAGDELECPVPNWFDRAFDLEVPAGWDGASPLPVLVSFHGGGGNKGAQKSTVCPGGNVSDAACLSPIARARGIAVVRPDGTGTRPATNVRTWNSGGGVNGLNCASGGACKEGIDDMAYFDALLAEVSSVVPVDQKRVFLTGLSNGGSIAYRIACERGDRIAAIVPVGAGNQFAAAGGVCRSAVAVLDVHGTADPCWTYTRSNAACLGDGDGDKVGVPETLEGWRVRNGCSTAVTETPLPDESPGDGTRITRLVWQGCAVPLEHLRVEGGGHTWPNGNQYFSEDRIGRVTRHIGSGTLVDFLLAHPRP